jgi:carboxymethylenebutenolidase
VARRVALADYVALAPDFMSQLGGTPPDDEQAMRDFAKMQVPVAVADGLKTLAYLRGRGDVAEKIGVVGFCWGGGMVNQLAVSAPDLAAGAAYYGVAPPLDKVGGIKAQLLLHYAGLDDRVNATRPAYEEALKKAGVRYTAYTYEGANHAFNDDTTARYDQAAATLAWQRTLQFFSTTLKG